MILGGPEAGLFPALLMLAGGMVMLTAGGEALVAGAIQLARRLGMSILLVGLTVVAFGTSMPELFVGLAALFQGYADIMVGNAVGSNIANIGLILALSALFAPLPVSWRQVRQEHGFILVAILALALAAWHGSFPRWLGLAFIAAIVFYTQSAYRQSRQEKRLVVAVEEGGGKKYSMPVILLLAAAGFVLLALGSDLFIDGAVAIARHFGASELVIGLTLAAVGTSLPELASCLAAVRGRHGDLVVGNIIGSNLFNLLMVMGSGAVFWPYTLPGQLLTRDLPVMTGFTVLLVLVILWSGEIKRSHGFVLLILYAVYVYLLA